MEEYGKLAGMALLTMGYLYYILTGCNICAGKIKNVVYMILSLFLLGVGGAFELLIPGVMGVLLVTAVFLYFYSDLREKCWRAAIPGAFLLLCGWKLESYGYFDVVTAVIILTVMLYILLSAQRGYLRWNTLVIVFLINGLLMAGNLLFRDFWIQLFLLCLSLLVFLLLEIALKNYELGYQETSKALQEKLMQRQFEEIRDIYLNMRGWRHDYHNHIQVLKADLDNGQADRARDYLNEIEHELDKVDTFVKSGNLMADAVLNSKLTLAVEQNIAINCDAYLPQELFLPDMDLCTILGNVLDNAMESCIKLPEEKRFIRIYISMVKKQFYLSVQNASQEIIGFEQKHYITTKRGNHGLGMKRVAAVVGRWNGYLNLNQEPGVFGTEITIPQP